MGQPHNPQTNPSNPQTTPGQKMPGQQDDKHRHSQGKDQPNRSGQDPGSKKPREQDE